MISDNQLSLMTNFFGGSFNQDWEDDANSPEEVVALYAQDLEPSERVAMANAILEFANRFSSDDKLEEALDKEFYCYFWPSGLGWSAKAWLQQVAAQFTEGLSG